MGRVEAFRILLLVACLVLADAANSVHQRELKAAKNLKRLARRSIGLSPSLFDNHIYYAEDQREASSYLSGKITLEPYLPTLVIDDVSEHYHRIECEDERIHVYFSNLEQLSHAEAAWSDHDSFVIVTSQPGCAIRGDHQAYRVSNRRFLYDSHVATLSTKKDSLHACTKRMHVSLETIEAHHRPTRSYGKRQDSSGSSSSSTAASSSVPFPSSISVPLVSAPTASPTGTSETADLGWHYQGVVFPPEGALGDALQALTNFPDHLEFSCVDCEAAGTIEVSTADFTTDGSPEGLYQELVDIFNQGNVTLKANGVRANFSLELSFLPGFQASIFTARVPSIPIVGFKLGNVIDVAAQVDLTFPFNIQLNSPVNMTTGFTLEVPDGSNIIVEVDDLGQSSITGFQHATLTPQQFNMNAPDLSFSFATGFQPQVNLIAAASGVQGLPTFDFLPPTNITAGGHIGVFLDLPMLNTTVKSLSGVSSTCDPVTDGGDSFDAINIIPTLVFDGGITGGWHAGIQLADANSSGPVTLEDGFGTSLQEGDEVKVVLLSTPPDPLETTCLKFNKKTSSLIGANETEEDGPTDFNQYAPGLNAAGNVVPNLSHLALFTSLVLFASMC